ncbi:uncharacterized protein LOC111040458 [Myzus persicae]|uniref:uncharacterized protein LOC111040458 n=1 Tax=Myzus persicae TaxID=13164 RepID=UPI000B937DD5|nr:uncharacterized protein LOC111040458 [Myzus persicae]
MSETTSIVMISCFELIIVGKFLSIMWRLIWDNQLCMVLSKLETIHERLFRLHVVGPMKVKFNWFFVILIIVNVIAIIITPIVWMTKNIKHLQIIDLIMQLVFNVFQCIAFFEYTLLVLYIQWMIYMINEQIPKRTSCLSSFRDLYLEVIECLSQVNRSIYGLPAIVVFIASSIAEIILSFYCTILFPRDYINDPYFVFSFISIFIRTSYILLLYGIAHVTAKEINHTSLVLFQRSLIERNPRIKRQIKFFLLRRLHEYFHFELYGICQINQRQLLILSNKAFAYLIIQILFKLNK